MGRNPAYPSMAALWTVSEPGTDVVVRFTGGLRLNLNGVDYRFFPSEIKILPIDVVHGLLEHNPDILRFVNDTQEKFYRTVYLPGLS